MAERPTKRENGVDFPAEAYAYTPDPEKPSTWKLRLWEDPEKKETPRQVGMAIAALGPGGFRGNRVERPAQDKAARLALFCSRSHLPQAGLAHSPNSYSPHAPLALAGGSRRPYF
ncbi:MAG TPA: hypothetical protein PLQ00_04170 [Thermoguttaceae bacterium]|jgi:hypothetical protein|nr:hypothetical protein [Thermoguttaceae bacterium]